MTALNAKCCLPGGKILPGHAGPVEPKESRAERAELYADVRPFLSFCIESLYPPIPECAS